MACWLSNIGKSLFIMGMTPSKSFSAAENNGQNNYKIWKNILPLEGLSRSQKHRKKIPESCMNSERNENRNWKKYLSGKVTFLYIVTCISYWFKEKASRDTWMSPRQASTWLCTRNFKNSELAEWMSAQKSLNQVSEWAIRNKTTRHPGGCPRQKQQSRPEQFKITLMPQ